MLRKINPAWENLSLLSVTVFQAINSSILFTPGFARESTMKFASWRVWQKKTLPKTEENREALMDKSWNFQNLELGLVIQFTMEARSDSTKRFFIKIIPWRTQFNNFYNCSQLSFLRVFRHLLQLPNDLLIPVPILIATNFSNPTQICAKLTMAPFFNKDKYDFVKTHMNESVKTNTNKTLFIQEEGRRWWLSLLSWFWHSFSLCPSNPTRPTRPKYWYLIFFTYSYKSSIQSISTRLLFPACTKSDLSTPGPPYSPGYVEREMNKASLMGWHVIQSRLLHYVIGIWPSHGFHNMPTGILDLINVNLTSKSILKHPIQSL